jgi:hypothetical protein
MLMAAIAFYANAPVKCRIWLHGYAIDRAILCTDAAFYAFSLVNIWNQCLWLE